VKHKKRIYLDYAAATPIDPRVIKKMTPFFSDMYGNPSSIHEEGRKVRAAIEQARKKIAHILAVQPHEILFTGSGTESIALALHGVTSAIPDSHILVSSGEHAAVLENAKYITQKKATITQIEPEDDGGITPKKIADAITKDTVLVSVMYINNEVGVVQPIREIARVLRKERSRRIVADNKRPLYFHTDACQAAEYASLSIPQLGVDLMTLNASKIYGPKGVGLLYVRKGISLAPLWKGGGQEQGIRSGTEHVAGITGFSEALQIVENKKQKEYKRVSALQAYFIASLQRIIPQCKINGPLPGARRSPNNIHITIPGITAETVVLYLDKKGIAASTGSACESNSTISHNRYFDGVRFTMGRYTTRNDIDYTIQALCDTIQVLRRSPLVA
jgi:cysteine desulfurase